MPTLGFSLPASQTKEGHVQVLSEQIVVREAPSSAVCLTVLFA